MSAIVFLICRRTQKKQDLILSFWQIADTVSAIAGVAGKSIQTMFDGLSLLKLSPEIQKTIRKRWTLNSFSQSLVTPFGVAGQAVRFNPAEGGTMGREKITSTTACFFLLTNRWGILPSMRSFTHKSARFVQAMGLIDYHEKRSLKHNQNWAWHKTLYFR